MAKNKTKWKIEIIVIELVIIATLAGVLFLKKVESYNFQSEATYFSDGVDFDIPSGSVAKVDKKTKAVSIDRGDDNYLQATGIPVYYKDQKKVVLMKDLAYLKPSNSNVFSYRFSYFTELTMDEHYGVTIQRDSNQAYETGGILFDGENSYFFLEDEFMEIGDKRISLPAYSYAYVARDNYIEYFNYDTKEIVIENIDGFSVYVRDINDSYRVNLSTDIISFKSDDVMLNGYIKGYKPYFEAKEE